MKLALQYLNTALIVVVALSQTWRLTRHRDDLALRMLAAGLLALAAAATIGLPGSPVKPLVSAVLGSLTSTFVNSMWLTMTYCFAAFFLLADRDVPQRRRVRLAQREFLLLAVVVLLTALLPQLFQEAFYPQPGLREYRSWQRVLNDVTINGTGIFFVVLGLIRASRYLRVITHTWLKWSVTLVCIGALGKAGVAGCALIKLLLRIIEDVDYPKRYPAISVVYLVSLLGGQTALALGEP